MNKHYEKIYIALGLVDRRIQMLSGKLLEEAAQNNVFHQSDFDEIPDGVHDMFADGKPFDFTRTSWFRPICKKLNHLRGLDLLDRV